MAFTFQINSHVDFEHNIEFLKKADANRTMLHQTPCLAKEVVELCQEDSKLCQIGVKKRAIEVVQLQNHSLKKDDSMILDFKEHCVGYFHISIDSVGSPMDAPLSVRLRFAEVAPELAQESSSYDGWLSRSWIQEEIVHIDELPCVLALPRRYSFRFVEIKVIDTSPKWQAVFYEPCVMKETSANISELQPCVLQDLLLQSIYDVSVKTLANCMQDVFEDGPKRDRRLWLGDLRLQALANDATFHQAELVKRCLYLFAAMPAQDGRIPANVFVKPKYTPDDTFLFDYSLFFISTLYDYTQQYPEDEVVQELYPVAKKQMDVSLQYVDQNGKLTLEEAYPVFIDWSNDFDKDTAAVGVLLYALKQFISLCERMQDGELPHYQACLERLIHYAKLHLYDEDKCLFVSGKHKEINIASQVWMVLSNCMSQNENKAIMKCCYNHLFPIQGIATPYMYHHVVEALFLADMKEEAIALMKSYWGEMISLGADTFWEAFDPDKKEYSPYGSPIISSYCHAWSCTPAYLLKKYHIDKR